MEFYNVILLNYQQTVPVSKNPRDIIYEEVCKIVKEHQDNKITYSRSNKNRSVQEEVEIKQYLGDKIDLEHNWKLRPILELIRKNPEIEVIDGKPILLHWKGSIVMRTSFIRKTAHNNNIQSKKEDIETDVSEVSDATKEVVSSIWPTTNSNKLRRS